MKEKPIIEEKFDVILLWTNGEHDRQKKFVMGSAASKLYLVTPLEVKTAQNQCKRSVMSLEDWRR